MVRFRSGEDVLVTQSTWRSSCAVTHKPPSAARRWLWQVLGCDLALPLPTLLWAEIVDDQFELRVSCGGRQHMVRRDLRINTSTSPICSPPPPLPNMQTATYINYQLGAAAHILYLRSNWSKDERASEFMKPGLFWLWKSAFWQN